MGTDRAADAVAEARPGRRKRRIVAGLGIGVLLVVAATALTLLALNDSFASDPTVALSILIIVIYIALGGVLASRRPENPIGWLFVASGAGLLLGGASTEWSKYALATHPGDLPFGVWAAWLNTWLFITVGAVPMILALFPTGHVASPRWRWLPPALLGVSRGPDARVDVPAGCDRRDRRAHTPESRGYPVTGADPQRRGLDRRARIAVHVDRVGGVSRAAVPSLHR